MPVLSYKYISDWYHLEEFQSGRKLIVKDWSEDQTQNVQDIDLLQGSIGPHVKNIEGSVWSQSINTPIIVFENTTNLQESGVFNDIPAFDQYGYQENNAGLYPQAGNAPYGVLDLLVDYWQSMTDFSVLESNLSNDFLDIYLMEAASLNLNQQGSNLSMNFKSDKKGPMTPVLGYPSIAPEQYIGRTAKPWDVTVQIGSFTVPGILDIRINFQVIYDTEYLMFPDYMSTSPFFAIKGWNITGSATTLLDASQLQYLEGATNPNADYDPVIQRQVPGRLFADNIPLVISYNKIENNDFNNPNAPYSSRRLLLSSKSATTKIQKDLQGGNISKVTIEFSCFATPGGLNG